MAFLNPNPALPLPGTMWAVYRCAIEMNPGSREALFMRVCPEPLELRAPGSTRSAKHVSVAITALVTLGMLIESPSGELLVNSASKAKGYDTFVHQLRRSICQTEVPLAVGDPDSLPGASDLARFISWAACQTPLRRRAWESDLDQETVSHGVINDTRWNGLGHWLPVLGFGAFRNAGLVIDISEAVVDSIQRGVGSVFERGSAMAINPFVELLRSELPILPGGRTSTALSHSEVGQVSSALALALKHADYTGVISLQSKSDAAAIQFELPGGRESFSHATVKGAKHA